MIIRDVGDLVELRLSVSPSDADTAAELAVTSPSGITSTPAAAPIANRSEWTAQLLVDEPGEWLAKWSVTGTGAGAERYILYVRPDPGGPDGHRIYATTADLAEAMQDAPPPGSRLLLARASRIVDEMLIGAIYETDDDRMPVKPRFRDALRDATCEQVLWWREVGDETGTGAGGQWDAVQIGSVRLSRGGSAGSSSSGDRYAPGAVRALRQAGLLPISPLVVG